MITLEELQAFEEMKDYPQDRWHSIRLNRLKEICSLASHALKIKAMLDKEYGVQPIRKGIDRPCALFSGPAGDCNKTNCIC